jgi:hypothetical protein
MFTRDQATKIIEGIASEKDPVQVLDLVKQAGMTAGIDIMEFYNNLVASKLPGESIEDTFGRLTRPAAESPKSVDNESR